MIMLRVHMSQFFELAIAFAEVPSTIKSLTGETS